MRELVAASVTAFHERYGYAPRCVAHAPGRVNLIGEHLDYNGGHVLPMAISRGTVIAAAPNGRMCLRVCSETLAASGEVPLPAPPPTGDRGWLSYLAGVAAMLQRDGHAITGADLLIASDLPLGSGLSSSAALEMAVVKVFEAIHGFQLDDASAARLGQRVEHAYLGLHSGIMDQFVIRAARARHAMLLDCATLAHEHVPFHLAEVNLVIINSGASRGLAASAYNDRVAACGRVAALLRQTTGRSDAPLVSFTLEDLNAVRGRLDPADYCCARHVISEEERVAQACDALRRGDAARLGELFNASHRSLAEDYHVTGPVLDALQAKAIRQPGCLGARMTGAGFGGCVIALVEAAATPAFCAEVASQPRDAAGAGWIWLISGAQQGTTLMYA